MARIDYIKYRLNNWALWKARDSMGGLGFAKQSVLLTVGASGHRESSVPVDETDATTTNEAIDSFKPERRHLYDVVHAYYLGKCAGSPAAVARELGKGASTISASLEQVDQALSIWFRIRAEQKKSFKT